MEKSLREHRKLKNMTQEELSISSGISIRTIQRIEKGLSRGSLYTLKTIANSLSIESSDITHIERDSILDKKNSIGTLKLINYSVLTMFVVPFGNIIFPALIYLINRSDSLVKTIGKRIIKIQILGMLGLPFLLLILLLIIDKGYGGLPITLIILYITYGLANIILTIHTSIHINQGREVFGFIPKIL